MKYDIMSLPTYRFFAGKGDTANMAILEAYGSKKTYIIKDIHIDELRDSYYGPECLEHIRENDEWEVDKEWIKQYFLDHLQLIEIIEP